MSFEQLNTFLQTEALVATFIVQLVAALIAYRQFRRFKRDRRERIKDKLTPILTKAGMFANEHARKQLESDVMRILDEELA
jgi:hypothetical protein